MVEACRCDNIRLLDIRHCWNAMLSIFAEGKSKSGTSCFVYEPIENRRNPIGTIRKFKNERGQHDKTTSIGLRLQNKFLCSFGFEFELGPK